MNEREHARGKPVFLNLVSQVISLLPLSSLPLFTANHKDALKISESKSHEVGPSKPGLYAWHWGAELGRKGAAAAQ